MPVGQRIGKGSKAAQMTDGLSNTVMLSEVLAWTEENEQGGGEDGLAGQRRLARRWMVPGMGASAFSGRFPPNSKGAGKETNPNDPSQVIEVDESSDRIPACGTGIENSAAFQDMPCTEDIDHRRHVGVGAQLSHRRRQRGHGRQLGPVRRQRNRRQRVAGDVYPRRRRSR